MTTMNQLFDSTMFFGGNAPFVEELYENYLENPTAVPAEWRDYFDRLAQMPGYVAHDVAHAPVVAAFAELARDGGFRPVAQAAGGDGKKQVSVLQLINAHRILGTRWAELDPLKRMARPAIHELELSFYGFSDADLNQTFNVGSFRGTPENAKLGDIVAALRETYCGSVGVEYMYMSDYAEKRWLQERLETIRSRPTYGADQKKRLLERLTAAETLERYLHTKYVGQKRFSLEGGESLIVAMDEAIRSGGMLGIDEVVIGMAHRGRLNVLVNTLGKAPSMLFAEFEGKKASDLSAGDVKYHMGFSSDVSTPGGPCHLTLSFNPSHLEIVNPVVEGSVYARQLRRGAEGRAKVLPVLIHGDSAFAGQGVIMETLQMSQARAFYTGGTVHVIINNQVGFTTHDPRDTRSTLYCSDVAKMVEAPILHVNGDDPESVVYATRLALEYRMKFHKDVVVDLVCYRRLGHNEADEPAATQPVMYAAIRSKPTTRQLYAERLAADGVIGTGDADRMVEEYRNGLDDGDGKPQAKNILGTTGNVHTVDWTKYHDVDWTEQIRTGVKREVLRDLGIRATSYPDGFVLHRQVQKIVDDRRRMAAGEMMLDWGFAETLAYATLLDEGYEVRLTGQDSGRGTFFHRHAVGHDQKTGASYIPLKHLKPGQPRFRVTDSLLSEEAVLGFEYGYSTTDPNCLVIWEGQFGDFVNGAQVIIDQFISSGEAKWGRYCGLTMFLPHGFEGQGPEHSSARLERFLQLCAENNMIVCVPSTPAQMFHMLRRQMRRDFRKPLVVMTPKSLLRHKLSVSALEDLSKGFFRNVIDEIDDLDPDGIRRVVFCSGKIYFDLLETRRSTEARDVAIVRVEQLYPFPADEYAEILKRYPAAKDVVWCQEEPQNQGAWFQIRHRLQEPLGRRELMYCGRGPSAAPATGIPQLHNQQQQGLVAAALRAHTNEEVAPPPKRLRAASSRKNT